MNIRTDFQRTVRTIEHCWIPMSDSTRLAARIWLPEDAEQDPVPALLEYLPYRKNDGTVIRDALRHPYFAGHGYASVRVDARGSGDSDGILEDEYLPLEQQDGLEILSWLYAQSWCTGRVGIFGKSWGGFNGLQIASCQPPELGGIITMCSTDDRYADDVHYKGGCVLAEKMLYWSSTMLAYSARPPDPKVVGDRWRDIWMERLEALEPGVHTWLDHQRRDDYWKQGSVCEDFSRITCPVYAVGGWADGFSDAVFRLLDGLECPKKGLIGPWAHNFPEEGLPGPAIGFLQQSLRWWDWCLKGIDTGAIDEPLLDVWIQDSEPFRRDRSVFPGFWSTRESCDTGASHSLFLSDGGNLSDTIGSGESVVRSRTDVGSSMGNWCPYGDISDFSEDQNIDDSNATTFTSAPIDEPETVVGFPKLVARLRSSQPVAMLAARLCDVSSGGDSSLVSWGVLNLTHHRDHETPEALVPSQPIEVVLRLKAIGYRIATGHRWRLSVSPHCWPFAWPSPVQAELTLELEGCRLELPVVDKACPEKTWDGEPETSPPIEIERLVAASKTRSVSRNENGSVIESDSHGGRFRLPDGLKYEENGVDIYRIGPGNESAETTSRRTIFLKRDSWDVEIRVESRMTAEPEGFHVENRVHALEDSLTFFEKQWTRKIRRDLV